MNKKTAEIVQVIIFLVIFAGQAFLASRYYTREDTVGTALFVIIAVLALVAAFGHFLSWREASSK